MALTARVGSGTGVEVLISAAAVADADWRGVFTYGDDAWSAIRTSGGTGLAKDVARFGRFGWINLAGPLTASGSDWSHQALLAMVEALDPPTSCARSSSAYAGTSCAGTSTRRPSARR